LICIKPVAGRRRRNAIDISQCRSGKMSILWTIIIGFVVGVIAKFVMPGDKAEPKGFILTTILGIIGAFVATYLGQAVGWYGPGESAGFIGGVIGAVILLFAYGIIAGRQGRVT
jgi:uncharacterized membrane protein YeaQ/YmgE (transglycosylase-associated protein family)